MRGRDKPRRSITTCGTTRFAAKSASASRAVIWDGCSRSRGLTSRIGCSIRRTTTGASSPVDRRICGPSPISALTGWTWPSTSAGNRFAPSAPTWRRFTRGGFVRWARARRSRARPGQSVRAPKRSMITTDDYGAVLLRFDGGARGLVSCFAGHRGQKEPADDRDCRKRRVRRLGQRIAQPALARFAQPARTRCSSVTRLCSPRRQDRSPIIREGTPRAFRTRSSSFTWTSIGWIIAGRQAGSPPEFPSFADGDREVRLCEAIGQSARTGTGSRCDDHEPA